MKIRNRRDFVAGSLFITIGTLFAFLASGYPLGTPQNMGAGFVPLALGFVVAILGLGVVAGSIARESALIALPRFAWRPLLHVCVPVALFGMLISRLGLVLCVFLVVVLSSLARKDFSIRSTLAVVAVLTTLSIGLFVWTLGMPMPVWPTYLYR